MEDSSDKEKSFSEEAKEIEEEESEWGINYLGEKKPRINI